MKGRSRAQIKRRQEIGAGEANQDLRVMKVGLGAVELPVALEVILGLEREFGGEANRCLYEEGMRRLQEEDVRARQRWYERVGRYVYGWDKRHPFKDERRAAEERRKEKGAKVAAGKTVLVESFTELVGVMKEALRRRAKK